ncbi:MAG TPA: hypothetical protein VKV27_16165 [Solirubrobacteraceae bacterium]|nr:hypothetical protein [Solirubrobacteraceae bacterium]
MRVALLAVALAFTTLIAVLTALDLSDSGFSWLDVPAVGVVVLFACGIVGALLRPPGR